MIHDDTLLDSIAILALGALPQAEAKSLANHIAVCQTCSREYASLRETANAVGYASELRPGELDELASARLKSRVMRAVRGDLPVKASGEGGRNGIASSASPKRPWLAYAAAIAAALVAVVSLGDDVTQRAANGRDATHVAQLESDLAAKTTLAVGAGQRARTLDSQLAQIVAPGSKHFAVATGEIIASGGHIFMAMRDLPALPKGRVYQAWTLASGAKTVAPSITFVPDAGGVTLVELPEGAAKLSAVALSVEPDGGSKAPTSKPTFVRALS